MGVSRTQVVKFIRKGETGNGISSVTEYYLASALSSGVTVSTAGWTTTVQTITATKKYLWNYEVITYSNGSQTTTTPVIIGTYGDKGDKGDQGDRGPTLRGPQAWSDCATGYAFQAGGAGEKWQDVVIYGNNYYSCVKSHTKTSSNYPGSTTAINNGYWQLGDKIELVATKILMATYALVKNLGVEAIDMKDANGNILFQAKDGAVTCKTGTFEDVNVTGNLTVGQLKYKSNMIYDGVVNGSFLYGPGNYVMPELSAGEYMRITLFNPTLTRTPAPAILTGGNANVLFLADTGNYFEDTVSTVALNGWHEFIGTKTADNKTLWLYQTIRDY